MTPREKLRRVVERMRQKTKHLSQRELDKAVDSALRLFSLKVIKIRGFPPVQVVDAKTFARQLRQRR